jgi:hypothetical protein
MIIKTLKIFLDFKHSPCFELRLLSPWLFPVVCSLNANAMERCVCSIFTACEDGTDTAFCNLGI